MGRFDDITAVLFDLGGTLVDYPVPPWPLLAGQCLEGVYAHLVRPEGELPPPAAPVPGPEEARRLRRPPRADAALAHRAMMAVRRIVRSLSGYTLPHMAEACARPLVAEGRLFDDALPTLGRLRERGYRLGLISNTPWGTPDYLWQSQLRRFGLPACLDVSVFSSAVGFRKPDPRLFREALERLGVPAARALFVGDDPRADVGGAQAAGLHAALLLRPGRTLLRSAPPPHLCIATLAELLDALPLAPKRVDSTSGAP